MVFTGNGFNGFFCDSINQSKLQNQFMSTPAPPGWRGFAISRLIGTGCALFCKNKLNFSYCSVRAATIFVFGAKDKHLHNNNAKVHEFASPAFGGIAKLCYLPCGMTLRVKIFDLFHRAGFHEGGTTEVVLS